ncbi:unnamed protein product [Gongylonema pulchrum]|uniref:Uncharacterized protein n=1 Tax=Gongylonema pulchrum TaxID=637853 RepID=A0A183D905_9BILA|nr:unnamed protein product [Gongylonema pulchrum]
MKHQGFSVNFRLTADKVNREAQATATAQQRGELPEASRSCTNLEPTAWPAQSSLSHFGAEVISAPVPITNHAEANSASNPLNNHKNSAPSSLANSEKGACPAPDSLDNPTT